MNREPSPPVDVVGKQGKNWKAKKKNRCREGFGEGKRNMRMWAIPRYVQERTPTQGPKRTKSTWRGKVAGKRKTEIVCF